MEMENFTIEEMSEICALNGLSEDVDTLKLAEDTLIELEKNMQEINLIKLALEVTVSTKLACNKNIILEKRAEAERKAEKKARKKLKKRDKIVLDDPIIGEFDISDDEILGMLDECGIGHGDVGLDKILEQIEEKRSCARDLEEEEEARRFWEHVNRSLLD